MNLTRNFSLLELTKSDTAIRKGIDNNPNADQIEKELLYMSEATNLDRIKIKFHEIHNSLKVNQEDKFNCLFDLV